MLTTTIAALEAKDWLAPAATLATGLISALLVIRQLSALRRRNEFDIFAVTGSKMGTRFKDLPDANGENAFYALRHRFPRETRTSTDYQRSLVERVRVVRNLSEADYRADLKIVGRVVNVLNEVAEVVDNKYVDHHKLLARYHLLLLREVFIVEPYIIHEVVLQTRGRWGMRVLQLGGMARAYNDMNPVHRRSVYYLRHQSDDADYGPIHEPPNLQGIRRLKRAWWAMRRATMGYPSITERTKRRQNDMLDRLRDRLHEIAAQQRTRSQDSDDPPLHD